MQSGALDLVGVIVDTDKSGPGMSGQVVHRPPDPATHVKHLHPRPKGQPLSQKHLVPEKRRLEALAPPPGGEVKRPAPAELVEIGNQVVVVIDERHVPFLSSLKAGNVKPLVLGNHGIHFIRGDVSKGTGLRLLGGPAGRSIVWCDLHDFSNLLSVPGKPRRRFGMAAGRLQPPG